MADIYGYPTEQEYKDLLLNYEHNIRNYISAIKSADYLQPLEKQPESIQRILLNKEISKEKQMINMSHILLESKTLTAELEKQIQQALKEI